MTRATLFAGLLPEFVSVAEMDPRAADQAWLEPEELEFVQRAVRRRKLEFAAGRALARGLLEERFGERCGALVREPSGVPRWPVGYVGSITHCRDLVAAAVATRADVVALGIDVEPWEPLSLKLDGLLLHSDEALRLAVQQPATARYQRRLIFSAKESIYKAVRPLLGAGLRLRDMSVTLGSGRFVATVHAPARDGVHLDAVHGQWRVAGQHVATAVALPVSQPSRSRPRRSAPPERSAVSVL